MNTLPLTRFPLLLYVMASAATASAQQPTPPEAPPGTARPSSDQSLITDPKKVGTSYLRETLSPEQAHLLSVAASGTKLKARSAPVHIVAPTSDFVNRSQADVFAAMTSQPGGGGAQPVLRAYTNYKIVRLNEPGPAVAGAVTPDGETPASMQQTYGMPQTGGSGVIAIVDAFQYPQADSDLQVFSNMFHLPQCRENKTDERKGCLQKLPQDGAGHESVGGIPVNCGWAGEAALDVEWAHALAPNAKIILVQANSDSLDDLKAAVKLAADAVRSAGGGQVSMSWSGGETQDEPNSDGIFASGVLYFAASGDVGGQRGYPAASPYVISVGGTGLLRDETSNLLIEYGWSGSGGGESAFEPLPAYQQAVENIQGTRRNIPDIAADADPSSGAAVFISTPVTTCVDHPSSEQYQVGWEVVGGTSLATPMVAAMVNVSGRHRASVQDELQAIYGNRANPTRIRDIKSMAGTAGGNPIRAGYDNVTGVGSPASVSFDAQ